MDHARCLCPRNYRDGKRLPVMCPKCPIHGQTNDNLPPWKLSENDKRFLRGMRIEAE
jgi:hypothetical protein